MPPRSRTPEVGASQNQTQKQSHEEEEEERQPADLA